MDTAEVREIPEHFTLTGREEKLLREIVFHEPRGSLDRFLQRPIKGATGILKTLITLAVLFSVIAAIYLVDKALEPSLDRLTSYVNIILVVALILQGVRISAREQLIRKVYHAIGAQGLEPSSR